MKKAIKSIKKGFTLVELIVVILIIAILAGVATGSYFIYIGVANQSADQQTVANYNTALTTVNTYLAAGTGNETLEGSDGNTYYLEPVEGDKNEKVDTANEAYTALIVSGYTMTKPKGYSDSYFVYVPSSNVFVIAKAAGTISYSQSGTVDEISGSDAYYFNVIDNSVYYGKAQSGSINSVFLTTPTTSTPTTSTPTTSAA